MEHLGLALAVVSLAVLGIVFSLLEALHKLKDGSGLDLMWTEMNLLKRLDLYRRSKYLPRGGER